MDLVLAVFVFSVIVLLWKLIFWKSNYARLIEAIPGPKCLRLPFIGHAYKLAFTPYKEIFCKMNQLMVSGGGDGSVMKFWIGNEPYICLIKARSLEAILSSSHHLMKASDYEFLHPWLRLGLLTSSGKHWHSRRKLLTPCFHFKILEEFVDIFNEQADILIQNLNKVEVKNSFDIQKYLTLCSLDIICETAMGTNVNAQSCIDSDYVKAVAEIGRIFFMRATRPWLKPRWLFNLTKWRTLEDKLLIILHSFSEQVIKDRLHFLKYSESVSLGTSSGIHKAEGVMGQKRRLAFLDMLLSASADFSKLSITDVREEVDTFMFEGHDTTTSSMSSTLLLLGHHPEIQVRVQNELDGVFGNSDAHISSSDLPKLKYLEAVIKESLRLYPSVPVFGRHLQDEIILDGYKVPAGTNLLLNVFLAHRDPQMFPDPEIFDPSRFLQENSNGKRHPYSYAPFSAGPRNCIGQKFAMMEEKVILSKILLKYNVKSQTKMEDIRFFTQPVLQSFDGIIVSIEPRQI